MTSRLPLPALLCLAVFFCLASCQTGIEPPPEPGILRVTIVANALDTTIVIQSDTSRFSRWDEFYLNISQGRVYGGVNYAPLYADPGLSRTTAVSVNILKREWSDGTPIRATDFREINTKNSRYVKHTVFESYVPPAVYDSLSLVLTAYEVLIYVPKPYMNPIQLPPGTQPQIMFPVKIAVSEGQVTQVNLEILPFKSLSRYRDAYVFSRQVRIVSIDTP